MIEIIGHGKYFDEKISFKCKKCGCQFQVDAGNRILNWIKSKHYTQDIHCCNCPECGWYCEEVGYDT